jgi:hypothetical protein
MTDTTTLMQLGPCTSCGVQHRSDYRCCKDCACTPMADQPTTTFDPFDPANAAELEEIRYENALSIIQARVDSGELIVLPSDPVSVIERERHLEQTLKALAIATGREDVRAISAEPGLMRVGTTRYRVVEIPKGCDRAKFEQYLDYMLDGLMAHQG